MPKLTPMEIKNIDNLITSSKKLRSQAQPLSVDEFIIMLKQHNFFDYDWNKKGLGFTNHFDVQYIKGNMIVIDSASGLMWQQGGSSEKMKYEQAKKWIEEINLEYYAGFQDWRLPTLEEAMSLMEQKNKNNDLYIETAFDSRQWGIWTSDLVKDQSRAWVVSFSLGGCHGNIFSNFNYVRAVRSI